MPDADAVDTVGLVAGPPAAGAEVLPEAEAEAGRGGLPNPPGEGPVPEASAAEEGGFIEAEGVVECGAGGER